uniref:RNA-binding protein Y14A-like n=1 Tax=Piliocolobus tephrosceles TaxID=591936 RepID=A0A8C9LLH1_9PRIM
MRDNQLNQGFNNDEIPAKSIEGWIIIITNIHGEAREDYIKDVFEKFGQVKNLHLNLDRRTGFLKGYAFLEFENFVDAKRAIDGMLRVFYLSILFMRSFSSAFVFIHLFLFPFTHLIVY